jgi:hypothetical protein
MQPAILYDPLQQPFYRATYIASTNGGVNTATAANTVTSLAYLFHPSSNTKRVEIIQIGLSWEGNGGNNGITFRGALITAENGTPGGSTQTVNALDQADAASTLTFRTGATGAPTRATGDYLCVAGIGGSAAQMYIPLFDASRYGKPIILRASQNEGFEIRSVIGGSNIASAVTTGIHFIWTEV